MHAEAPLIATGMLPLGGGHELWWETSGAPDGVPVLHLHGGPGTGLRGAYRTRQDPARHLVVGFDQRGCGRSRPLATDPNGGLETQTTPQLVADIEALRAHLGVERWLVVGGSWGTTLALAYAQAHPDRVTGLVLAAVTSTTTREVDWVTEGVGRIFPIEWAQFAAAVPREPGERVVDAYARVLATGTPDERAAAAAAWCVWEDVHVSLIHGVQPGFTAQTPEWQLLVATLVTHYWAHSGFGGDEILGRMPRLAGIPGVLVHGIQDVSAPLETAYRLHRAWPGSELHVVREGHGGASTTDLVEDAIARLTAPDPATA